MMRTIYLPTISALFAISMLLISLQSFGQQAECDSINNELTSKFRFLGEWDANGTPEYMDPASDEVSQALIDFVNNTLPESVNFANANDNYFGLNVQLNTELKEASEVYLTLVHEGAGWKNTLGYYTYDINDPPADVYDIDSLVILFPNVSQTDVIKPGDKVLLGEFPANTGIGYFLIAQGWVGDTICLKSHMIFTDAYLNTFTTEEYQQHTILLSNEQENKFLLGFEDIKRPGGDNDFNDAVFYITAMPGAIDTTNIPKIPTAFISGDTTLCNELEEATFSVELTGEGPWTIVYNNGSEDVEVENIETDLYTFTTLIKDTIKLVSVKDQNQYGIVEGEAVVDISAPRAILDEEQGICGGGNDNSGFIISLEGEAPFSLSFMVNDELKSLDNILENQIEVKALVGQKIELISMTDKYCEGEIVGGVAVIQSYTNPNLFVNGTGAICGEAMSTSFDLNLEGTGPWTLSYLLNGVSNELVIESNEYQFEVSELGLLTFTSLKDESCDIALTANYTISNSQIPTAEIDNSSSLCGEEMASVDLSLTGEGPWTVNYKFNEEALTANSDEESLSLSFGQGGLFELIGISDANCENLASGNVELKLLDVPTAFMSGDYTLCDETETQIQVELSGQAPFNFVYSDGETETSITTDETIYTFNTEEFKTYTLISVDDANCEGNIDGSATISDGSEEIQVEIEVKASSCFGEDIELALIGETDDLSISWATEGSGQLSNMDQLTTIYSPGENESGAIVFYADVTNGCAGKTISKEVSIIEEINVNFDVSPKDDHMTNSQITFTPSNNNYDEYNWNFGDENTSQAVIASNEYSKGGIYTVELSVSLEGCEGIGSTELEVLSKDELYVPNAFNPNAFNSENQVVKVYSNNVDEFGFSFKIVNRWGKVMYETNSFNEANTVGWDGINNNNSEELELNVFTYILKGQFIDGESFERTGTVTQVK